MKYRHGSLFSGIGGFDLAAEWAGFENVFQVEIDKFCQKVLSKNFPNTEKFYDIYDFKGKKYRGTIDIISGGFPCQPFSLAGKRVGTGDERHLFPEMLRVVSEIRPTWVVGENVYGLLNIEGGMAFENMCVALERLSYEVQTFIIPAAGVNAPHKRDRLWIIAYSDEFRKRAGYRAVYREDEEISERNDNAEFSNTDNNTPENSGCKHEQGEKNKGKSKGQDNKRNAVESERPIRCSGIRTIADANSRGLEGTKKKRRDGLNVVGENCNVAAASSKGLQGRQCETRTGQHRFGDRVCNKKIGYSWSQNWLEVAAEFCGVDDGLPVKLGKFKLSKSKHRIEQLKAYGNAIVPQVAFEIFKAIRETESAR